MEGGERGAEKGEGGGKGKGGREERKGEGFICCCPKHADTAVAAYDNSY